MTATVSAEKHVNGDAKAMEKQARSKTTEEACKIKSITQKVFSK